ncbi:MAG TPA: cation diffusion facilitator family transporter [Bacteroidales bacterium]
MEHHHPARKKHSHQRHSHAGDNLLIATVLNITITIVEVAGGLLSNSIALLSDALHNFGDSIAVFLAYVSNKISQKGPSAKKTFGYKRVEIIAAMLNSLILVVICAYLLYESWHRMINPKPVQGLIMTIVATVGLLANLFAVFLLHKDKNRNINIKAAYLHLLSDTVSSIGVVIGGLLIYFYKIYWIDPIITIIISLYIFKETWGILKQAYLILIQAAPEGVEIDDILEVLERYEEIENVHHVHIWKLNDTEIHFECHIDMKNNVRLSETEELMHRIKKILFEKFNIVHTTIQFEYNCCDDKSIIYK